MSYFLRQKFGQIQYSSAVEISFLAFSENIFELVNQVFTFSHRVYGRAELDVVLVDAAPLFDVQTKEVGDQKYSERRKILSENIRSEQISTHLNTRLVQYSNCRFVPSCQMVYYSNGSLKTGQKKAWL